MKNSSLNLSIIISVSFESDSRREVFHVVLKKIAKDFPNEEIIVVHNDKSGDTGRKIKKVKNVVELFFDNPWSKSLFNNLGAKNASHNILCFLDSDCLVDKKGVKLAAESLCHKFKLAYPFRYFKPLRKTTTLKFLETKNSLNFLDEFLLFDDTLDPFQNPEGAPKGHPGGVQMITKDTFKEINGYNTNIKTWGGTDIDLIQKITRFYGHKTIFYCFEPINCFHLWHERPKTHWYSTYKNHHSENFDLLEFYNVLSFENFKKAIFLNNLSSLLSSDLGDQYKTFKKRKQNLADFIGYAATTVNIFSLTLEKLESGEKFDVHDYILNLDSEIYNRFINEYNLPKDQEISLDVLNESYLQFISIQNKEYSYHKMDIAESEYVINDIIKSIQ